MASHPAKLAAVAAPGLAQLAELFEQALELPESEQPAFVQRSCADPALRDRLQRMLQAERGSRHWTGGAIGVAGAQARALERAPVEQLGPYRLGAMLGAGGMGRVFAASRNDGRIEQQVAIKLLHSHRLDDAARRRFDLERRLLARLGHPAIVRALDAGELADGTPFVVMEQVDGLPLHEYLRRHRPALRTRVELLLQVCHGVAAAHAAAIVHRDLKPGNVMVDGSGRVRLLDFGIAKALDGNAERTRSADRAFSLEYAAPEQLSGDPITLACDVHALGVMLYELLCGERPYQFDGLAPAALAAELCQRVAPPPSRRMPAAERGSVAAALLDGLDRICAKALRKAAAERYADAAALAADLQRWLDGRPVLARRAQPGYRWRLFLHRQRHAVMAAAASLAVLLASTAGWWRSHDQSLAAQQRAASAESLTAAQQQRASRLAGLTLELIRSADPRQGPAQVRPGSSWLMQLDAQLDASLRDDPLLAAELAGALAEIWLALGQPQRCLETLDPALARLPPGHAGLRRELLASRLHALVQLSRPVEARALLAELPPPADAPLLAARIAIDALQVELIEGHYESATPRLAALAAELAGRHGRLSLVALRAAQLHVDSLALRARPDEADAANRALLERQREAFGERHLDTARSLWRAANLASQLGRGSEAQSLARRTTAVYREIYGSEGKQLFSAVLLEGNVTRRAGAPERARELYEQARAIGVQALGADHPNIALLDFNLAQLLDDDLARPEQAERLYRSALAQHVARLGATHPTSGLIGLRLGSLLNRQGLPGPALAVLDAAAVALQDDAARSAQVAVERSTALLALNRIDAAAQALLPAAAFFDPAKARLDDPRRKARALQLQASLSALGHGPRTALAGLRPASIP